ncbi:peptidase S16 [Alteromonas sp. a30]|nr:peptidase S16 [Alteromonas sp. a30]
MQLPLFPLPAHILPGGRLALRVFESRYLRMVKDACLSGSGFGICMLNDKGDKDSNQHIYPIGTWVQIVDFNQLENGLLGLLVEGQSFFTVRDIVTDSDGLRIGECEIWSKSAQETQQNFDCQVLRERLKELFDLYPEFEALYEKPQFDDCRWVLYRWMEVLPVSPQQKQMFIEKRSLSAVYEYLQDLVR